MASPLGPLCDEGWQTWLEQSPAWTIHLESQTEALIQNLDTWLKKIPDYPPDRPDRILLHDWIAAREEELTKASKDSSGHAWALTGLGSVTFIISLVGAAVAPPLAFVGFAIVPLTTEGIRLYQETRRQALRYADIKNRLSRIRTRSSP